MKLGRNVMEIRADFNLHNVMAYLLTVKKTPKVFAKECIVS
jgi:hypothetical protein